MAHQQHLSSSFQAVHGILADLQAVTNDLHQQLVVQRAQQASQEAQQAGQGVRPPSNEHFNLLGLPVEIIMMIFREVGNLPEGPQTQIGANDAIHPCYAICGTSKFLQDCYIAAMGLPPEVGLAIEPSDYIAESPSQTPTRLLDRRLRFFGSTGRKYITKLWISGPQLERTTTSPSATKFLDEGNKSISLAPGDLEFIKQHVEEDIRDKQDILNTLFKNLLDMFGTKAIKSLSIYVGEVPASSWKEALVPYISSQENLRSFRFTNSDNTRTWSKRGFRGGGHGHYFSYHPRLLNVRWYPTRLHQPDNYPATLARHKRNFETLHDLVNELLRAKERLETSTLSNNA